MDMAKMFVQYEKMLYRKKKFTENEVHIVKNLPYKKIKILKGAVFEKIDFTNLKKTAIL